MLTITRQLEAFIQLRNLIGPIPGQLHGWPISADFALHMLHQLLAELPELVIEWGSGTSTFLLLQALAQAYPQAHRRADRPLPALLQAIRADPARPLQITLLLDDLIRADEQATAAAWQALLTARGIPSSRRDLPFEKGAMELRFPL